MLLGCTFKDNSAARSGSEQASQGGCVFAEASTMLVNGTTFTNCTAEYGGGLYWQQQLGDIPAEISEARGFFSGDVEDFRVAA